jgi:DNA-binding MarR family transcriptional regulator
LKQFGIPKGSVSKITRKLVQQQMIRTEFLPDNKKEVLFLTTPLGKETFDLHQELHQEMNKGITRFLQRYNTDELLFLMQAFEDTLEASWVHSESVTEEELLNAGESLEVMDSDEMNQIVDMLNQLDTRNLKKAKTILQAVFFTSFE